MYLERQAAAPQPQNEEPQRLQPQPTALSPQAVIALQRSAGNAAVSRVLAREPGAAPAAAAPAAGGVDWLHVWDVLTLSEGGAPTWDTVRLVGELGRVAPVAGLIVGAGADVIGGVQDLFGPSWKYEAPFTHALIGLRGVVNLLNNAFGHISYLSMFTQDALAASGVSLPFTATLNVVVSGLKTTVDTGQAGLDATIATAALWNALESGPPAPGDEAQFDAWLELAANFEANLMGDWFDMVIDGIDVMTAGAAHGSILEDVAIFMEDLGVVGRRVFDVIVTELQGQLNLRGEDLVTGGAEAIRDGLAVARTPLGREVSAESLALDGAVFTLRQMQGAHQVGDDLIGQASGTIGEFAARADEIGRGLLDGQEPFAFVREQAETASGEMRTRIAMLADLAQAGSDSAATTESVLASVAETRAALEAIEVPEDLELEAPDLGEGALADAGEALLGAGADLAGQGVLAQIRSGLDAAKLEAFEALDTFAESADEIGRFMALLAEQSERQAAALKAMLERFEDALGRTENFQQLFEMLIEQSLAAAGIAADVDFAALRGAWDDAGGWIDQMLADFQSRQAGGPPMPVDEAGIRNAPRLAGGGQSEEP